MEAYSGMVDVQVPQTEYTKLSNVIKTQIKW